MKSFDLENLVDEVVRELTKRLDMEKGSFEGLKKKAKIIGTLSPGDFGVLSGTYERWKPDEGSYDVLIVAELSVSALARAALGCPADPASEAIIEALLNGKPVFFLESGLEYRRYRSTAHRILYNLYQSYENTLVHSGVRVLSDISDLRKQQLQSGMSDVKKQKLQDETAARFPSVSASDLDEDIPDFSRQRILTESDVAKARRAGTLYVGGNTLLTPLARDYIESHGLILRHR